MTFEELKTELERMSPEQLQQEVSAFVVRKGAQYNCPVALQYAEGDDALNEAGDPYFLVGDLLLVSVVTLFGITVILNDVKVILCSVLSTLGETER